MKETFEKPPVTTSKSGVQTVLPADILKSRLGQQQIRETAASSLHKSTGGEIVHKGNASRKK